MAEEQEFTNHALSTDTLTLFQKYLSENAETDCSQVLKRDVLFGLSNVCASVSTATIQSVFQFRVENSLPLLQLISQFASHQCVPIRLESLNCFANLLYNGTFSQKKFVIDNQLMNVAIAFKKYADASTLLVCLDFINTALTLGEHLNQSGNNMVATLLEEQEVIEYLEKYQDHEDNNIYEECARLLQKQF